VDWSGSWTALLRPTASILPLLPFLSVLPVFPVRLLCCSLPALWALVLFSRPLEAPLYPTRSLTRRTLLSSRFLSLDPRVGSLPWIIETRAVPVESGSSINCFRRPQSITGLLTFLSASSSSWLFALPGLSPHECPGCVPLLFGFHRR
jgi:hypothetical protein